MLVPPDGRVSCELTLLPYNACAAAFTVGEYHAGLLLLGQLQLAAQSMLLLFSNGLG